MADFSTKATDIETTIQPGATVLNPVTREGEINALEEIGRGIQQGAKVFATWRATQEVAAGNKYRADFTVKLNSLQDAHDQGAISDSEFRTRSRALLSQAVANSPAQTEDLLGDYSKFQNQSGLDKIAAPGVQKAQLKEAQVKAAVDNGFLSVKDIGNPEKEAEAIDNIEKFQTSVRELKVESDKVAAESAKLELGSKQRADSQARQQEVVTNGLAKIGRDALPYWRTQYENIKVKAAQAGTEQERQQIIKDGIAALETDYAQRTASFSGDALSVDQGKIDQILKPQRDLINTYIKELSGEYDTESFDRFTKGAEARAKAMAWEGLSDETRRWIAVSEIAKAAGPIFANKIQTGVVEAFNKNANAAVEPREGVGVNQGSAPDRAKPYDVLPSSSAEKKTVTDYLTSITTLIEDKNAGKYNQMSPEEQKNLDKEIDAQMASIFRGVNVHANSTESAKEFQPVVDFFSNPVIGEYLKGKGVPAAVRADLSRVMQDGYASQVVPMLRSELNSNMFNQIRLGPDTYQLNEVVEPTMEGGRFGFKLKSDFSNIFAAKASLRALNESAFTKVMNKMIISNSHIRGDTDYNKSYEEIAPLVFDQIEGGSVGVDEQTTGSVEQEFELEDLVQLASADAELGVDATTLEGDLKEIGAAIDIGEAGGDYGALLGFTNRPGRKFDDIDVSSMTVNELLDFSSPDGAYGTYSKKQVGRVATPMGRYQIVGKTLRKLKNELGLTGDEVFDASLQDRMFLQLLKGRGYTQYKNGELSKEQFLSNLKNEWEGLKKSRESFNALVASL